MVAVAAILWLADGRQGEPQSRADLNAGATVGSPGPAGDQSGPAEGEPGAAGGAAGSGTAAPAPAGPDGRATTADPVAAASAPESESALPAGSATAPADGSGSIPVPAEYEAFFRSDATMAELHRRLEAEADDPQWADRIESALRQHFGASLDPAMYRVDVVECRTSTCEMLAIGYDEQALRGWMSSISGFVQSFGTEAEFVEFFGGPARMGCGGAAVSPDVIALSCMMMRMEPGQRPAPAASLSLSAPYPDDSSVEPVPVAASIVPVIESNAEIYELHRRLEREATDFGWANYLEPLLAEYVQELDPAIGMRYLDVTCRATLCEVQMMANGGQSFLQWVSETYVFQQLDWHDLKTRGIDIGDVRTGGTVGVVWMLERDPPGD
jgi:hypothetical protein